MSGRLDKLKILVVDDSPQMIRIVKAILRGFEVKDIAEAASGQAGFEHFRSAPFDIVITDLVMSPMDGCGFTRAIRGPDSPNRFVPVIMLTAYSEKSNVEAARDAGATEFCAKPVTAGELYRKIGAVINQPRPFVRTKVYFGPDRRRRQKGFAGLEKRAADTGTHVV